MTNDGSPENPPRDGKAEPVSSMEAMANGAIRYARRLVVAVVGGTVILVGIVMLVTPGPAMVLIPAGLAILAIEFAWARRLLRRVKREVSSRLGGAAEDPQGQTKQPPQRDDSHQAS